MVDTTLTRVGQNCLYLMLFGAMEDPAIGAKQPRLMAQASSRLRCSPTLTSCRFVAFTKHRWEKYLELRSKVLDIEDSLAEEYFSHELMAVLRHQDLATSANESYAWIVARMKPQIVDFIHDKPINHRKMIDIVNFIRNNPEEFPEWHNSDTAKLFSPPKFKNKKENKGYWF